MKINFIYKGCDIEIIATPRDKYYFDTKTSLSGIFNGFKCEIKQNNNGYSLFIENEYFGNVKHIYEEYTLDRYDDAISILGDLYKDLIETYSESLPRSGTDKTYQLFCKFSNEEIEFIEKNIGSEYGQDNIRVGVEGDENSMNAYTLFRSFGCCGFSDEVFEFNNKTFHIGYNYGH